VEELRLLCNVFRLEGKWLTEAQAQLARNGTEWSVSTFSKTVDALLTPLDQFHIVSRKIEVDLCFGGSFLTPVLAKAMREFPGLEADQQVVSWLEHLRDHILESTEMSKSTVSDAGDSPSELPHLIRTLPRQYEFLADSVQRWILAGQ
jgi:hypothetical protein